MHKLLYKSTSFLLIMVCIIISIFVALAVVTSFEKNQSPFHPGYQPLIIGTAIPAGEFEEALYVQVNNDTPSTSQRIYSGAVSITIHGEGVINANLIHDAFYIIDTVAHKRRAYDGFYVDELPPLWNLFFERPRYNPDHVYSVLYVVGERFRPIQFRIENGNPHDKSQFEVQISVRNLVGGSGR